MGAEIKSGLWLLRNLFDYNNVQRIKFEVFAAFSGNSTIFLTHNMVDNRS